LGWAGSTCRGAGRATTGLTRRASCGGAPYAVGAPTRYGFRIRRILFGKLAASYERYDGEEIRAVELKVADTPSKPVFKSIR
jgi:hypothetical protein